MDTYAFSEYSAIPSSSAASSSSWSSAGNRRTADIPGLPSYASHILNFDPAPALPRTLHHREHYPREQVQPGSPYASPYVSRSPYAVSSTNSPFLSANSPFLSERPTETKRNIHSPPPFNLEPLANDWNTSTNGELFVNVSDLTSSRSSSENSPTTAVLCESAQQSSPHHYDHHANTEQTPSIRKYSGKRKRPSNALSSPSSPRPETSEAVDVTSPESGSAYASSYNDDESSYSDSDSSYVPSPGRSRRSRPRKRARVSEDNDYQFVSEGGKKSRGRKVPVTQEFGAVEGSDSAQVTTLPSIPYGIKKAGAPQKNKRRYVCTFEGCGKCFVRGEHLKRHVKSLHLCEKPHECTFPGCTKSFSRKDNLKQHINIFHPDFQLPCGTQRDSSA